MTEPAELLEQVRAVPLFAHCRDRHLGAILRSAKERSYAAGATIVEEGQEGVAFYLVLEGQVEVRQAGRTLATLGAGDHFGELALLSHRPVERNASVVATAPTRCLLLAVWDFRGLLDSDPEMARHILAAVADRLRDLGSSAL